MTDTIQAETVSSKATSWLLEVDKSLSGPPSKALLERLHEPASYPPLPPSNAFLARLQYVQEHPEETDRELREDAVSSGRDPHAFVNMIAEVSIKARQVQTAQRPKDSSTEVMAEDLETVVDRSNDAVLTESEGRFDTPYPAATTQPMSPVTASLSADLRVGTETQSTRRPTQPAPSVQRRLGAKGQITKPTKFHNRDEQDASKEQLRKRTMKNGRTGSMGSTELSMNVDNPLLVADETVNATSRSLENQDVPVIQAGARSYPFPIRSTMPPWYATVSQKSLALLDRRRPREMTTIDALKACIARCEQEKHPEKLAKAYNEMRDYVHKAEIMLDMDKMKAKKTRILADTGLPRIFAEHASFPMDLKADAWHLYERWMDEDFDNDILRGIVTVKGESRHGDRLDPAYKQKHPKDPKTFGNNGAILGQWWPSQLCTLRDGIHGAAQGGIHGDKERGTYSIVLSSGGYHDRDYGDVIEYSGTEGSNFEVKAATQSMITSSTLGNHIRVLRSSQLPKSNKHRPSCGLRYDGLYQITSYEVMDLERQTYRFRLERIPGQEPIRSQGATKRPTVFEEEAYQRCKGRI